MAIWSEKELYETGCTFNPRGVQCTMQNKCGSCGWNQAVEQKRKEARRHKETPVAEEADA